MEYVWARASSQHRRANPEAMHFGTHSKMIQYPFDIFISINGRIACELCIVIGKTVWAQVYV